MSENSDDSSEDKQLPQEVLEALSALRPLDWESVLGTFFPPLTRLEILHDGTAVDGDRTLRIETQVSRDETCPNSMLQLFNVKMYDLGARYSSLRRYRSSEREICYSHRNRMRRFDPPDSSAESPGEYTACQPCQPRQPHGPSRASRDLSTSRDL